MRHYTESEYKLAAELSPIAVDWYLVAHGYRLAAAYPGVAVYSCVGAIDSHVEVFLDSSLSGYGRRMCETLDAIGSPFLGLLHAIDPERFPRERILALVGVTA